MPGIGRVCPLLQCVPRNLDRLPESPRTTHRLTSGSYISSAPLHPDHRHSLPRLPHLPPPLRHSTSFPQTITVTNTGTTAVTPGNSCTINVSFSPTAIGSRNANVQIIFNATTSPSTVTLSGTAQ